MDATDADNSFYNNIFDISQSQKRMTIVSEGSIENFLQSICSNFAILDTATLYPPKGSEGF